MVDIIIKIITYVGIYQRMGKMDWIAINNNQEKESKKKEEYKLIVNMHET